MTLPTGIHPNIPFEDYLAIDAINQSTLKEGRKSMAHLRAAEDDPNAKKATDDMKLGSALHVAFLEPELMPEKVAIWEGGTRRGKEWDVFKAGLNGRADLTVKQYESLKGMVRSLRKHPEIRRWANRIEDVEVTGIRECHGVLCKARCDALTDEPMIDLKKTRDGDPRLFARQMYDLGYHIQAAHYMDVFQRNRFVLATVEDKPPFDVVLYELDEEALGKGRKERLALLQRVKKCQDTGVWPGRADEIVPLSLPEWARDEVTCGGKPVKF